MSGGHFNYIQNQLSDTVEQIRDLFNEDYDPETITKFQEAADTAEKAAAMIKRIDWLISCDDSEETFHKRWKEDVLDVQPE
jgi:hypothetical protein